MIRLSLSCDLIARNCYHSHVVSLHDTDIALTWSDCMLRLSFSRGLIAWYGYRPHVVPLHDDVTINNIILTWSHCMVRISLPRDGIAWNINRFCAVRLSLSRCPEADKDGEDRGAERVGVVPAHGHVHPRQDSHDARRNQPGQTNGEQYV